MKNISKVKMILNFKNFYYGIIDIYILFQEDSLLIFNTSFIHEKNLKLFSFSNFEINIRYLKFYNFRNIGNIRISVFQNIKQMLLVILIEYSVLIILNCNRKSQLE